MAEPGHVFVSYSRDDRDYVTDLVGWLEGHGVSVWYDHDIDHGARWKTEINEQLDAAGVVIAVMSGSARASRWVDRELDAAEQRGIPILPLLLERDGVDSADREVAVRERDWRADARSDVLPEASWVLGF